MRWDLLVLPILRFGRSGFQQITSYSRPGIKSGGISHWCTDMFVKRAFCFDSGSMSVMEELRKAFAGRGAALRLKTEGRMKVPNSV